MKTIYDSGDLVLWRRDRKMTQAGLAAHLNVSRNTISNWEAGKGLPMDLADQLGKVDVKLRATADGQKPVDTPAFIAARFAYLRPDLRLYKTPKTPRALPESDVEHPRSLFWHRQAVLVALYPEHLSRDTQVTELARIPWAFLEHPVYLEALAQFRASEKPRTLAAGVLGLPDEDFFD